MKISRIVLDEVNPITSDICACIGYFDGLHLGHQALVKRT
ncbi:MAG: hypothetical protein HUJ56_02295, partial [Erysipelotrichaceae bacterium]|nr:hypothetical protein [Erysipelotrichaceae bacterium]